MEKDIGKINKNETTDILLRVDDFAERRGLTIREFVTSDRYTGFTKSGIKIMAADFPKFKEMINSITEEDMKEEVQVEQPEQGQETLGSSEIPEAPKPEEISEEQEVPTEAPQEEIKVEKPGESEEEKESLPDY